jgi:hypothetical protein
MEKKFNPKVSIVIPVYNGSNYLKEAIDSALAQTYKNTEVIVINDGSKDEGKTDAICKSYDNKIRYFKKENGGVASALNMGIEKMKGEYFSWLSHDDVYYPEKVERQIEFLSNLEDKDVVLYASYELIDEESNPTKRVLQDHELLRNKPEYSLLRGRVNGITMLIPKKAFDEYGSFNEDLKCTQDYDMWMRIAKGYKFVHMDEIFTKTRIHAMQDSNKHPNVIKEGDVLWINMMEALSSADRIRLEGTEYNFYREMKLFLETNTNYEGALKFAEKRMKDIYEMESSKGSVEDIMVSVVVPFYNGISDLLESLDSVLSQSHEKLEVLLINDGSEEGLVELKEKVQRESRCRIINLEKNYGPSKARNVGIEEAKGDYVAFLDADDLFLPNKIGEQLLHMYLTGSNISHTSYKTEEKGMKETVHSGELDGVVIPQIIESCTIATPTVMIRNQFLKDTGYRFREDLRVGEDTVFWLEVLKNQKILGIDKPLTEVKVDATSARNDLEKHLEGLKNILAYILSDNEYSEHYQQIAKLCLRYAEVAGQVALLRKGDVAGEDAEGIIRKFIRLSKYQGVLLTAKKIFRKYSSKITSKIIKS